MTVLTRLLVLLGLGAELWVVIGLWDDLLIDGTTPELMVLLSPLPVALGAAWLSARMHRRGSRWAWLVAGLPFVVLVLVLGLALLLTLYPPRLHAP